MGTMCPTPCSCWCSLSVMLLYQVEQREQEDPDEIHDVPVEPAEVHRCEPVGPEAAFQEEELRDALNPEK